MVERKPGVRVVSCCAWLAASMAEFASPRVALEPGDIVRTRPNYREAAQIVTGVVTHVDKHGGIRIDASPFWCSDRQGVCVVVRSEKRKRVRR